MITRATAHSVRIFISCALFAVSLFGFSGFVHADATTTTGTPSVIATTPVDNAQFSVGDTINIGFTANNLSTQYVNIQLLQSGTPILQIATVPVTGAQTAYSTPWTIPTLSLGSYTIKIADSIAGSATSDTIPINIVTATTTTPLVNIDPSQVVFDASTGTYYYTGNDPAQEAAFNQQISQLSGSGNSGNSSQTGAAVGVIGDALINSAGSCVGTALAKSLASAIGSSAVTFVAPTAIPVNSVTYTQKEVAAAPGVGSWDSIGYCIANGMIQTLGDSITKWINNDFQLPDGTKGAAYLQNPTAFFKNLTDVTAGQFLGSLSIGGVNLCSSFSLQLRLNLLQQYRKDYSQRATCTLSSVVKNLQGFTNGDFSQGGWEGWFSMTQNPANNYYGSYLQAADELGNRITSSHNQVTAELANGNGFLSYKKCTAYGPSKTVNGQTVQGPCISSQTLTPGKLIEEAANKGVQNPNDRLVVANSFDQVVTALVTTMVKRLQNFNSNGTGI